MMPVKSACLDLLRPNVTYFSYPQEFSLGATLSASELTLYFSLSPARGFLNVRRCMTLCRSFPGLFGVGSPIEDRAHSIHVLEGITASTF